MAINKITPRALDKATDHRLVPSTSFIDAVNVVVNEDEGNGGDDGGDAGVIKNLRGNTAIQFHSLRDVIAPGDCKIIGTTTDHKLKLVYLYVYHEDANEQGVWVYDPYGKLSLPVKYAIYYRNSLGYPMEFLEGVDPYAEGTIKCVVKGNFFDFKQNSVVQGNVVYGNTLNVPSELASALGGSSTISGLQVNAADRETFEKDFHLYFTDNVNEPKKLNVTATMIARAAQADSFQTGVNSQYIDLDFDGDGVITGSDITTFQTLEITWGSSLETLPDTPYIDTDGNGVSHIITNPSAFDFDGDGTIDFTDLQGLLALAGIEVSPPSFFPGSGSRFSSSEGGWFSIPANNAPIVEKAKFCHACKPTPLVRPTFEFVQDESSSVNNFERQEGFKFAYQILYNDGTKSAISPKSEIAIPPSIIFQGADKNPDHSSYNVCRVSIDLSDINPDGYWNHVKQVNILAQQGDGGYSIIHESRGVVGSVLFDFKNDVLGIPVASKEENKFFDSVPLKAEAQSVVDNRLMYGNYVEGFQNENIEAQLSVIYNESSNEGFVGPTKVYPCIVSHQQASAASGTMFEKSSGFQIEIPDGAFPEMSVGNILKFSIKFFPGRNFHLYKGVDSFHQSRHWGKLNSDEQSQDAQNFKSPNESGLNHFLGDITGGSVGDLELLEEVSINTNGTFGGGTDANAIINSTEQRFFPAYSKNGGIASGIWTTFQSNFQGQPGPIEVDFGTSAANPFVIPGAVLTFGLELRCIQAGDPDVLRAAFFDLARNVMAGKAVYQNTGNSYFDVEDVTRFSTTEWDLNLGYIERFDEGSDLSKLISAGVYDLANRSDVDHPDAVMPVAHVIPNKGKATFRLSPTLNNEGSHGDFQMPPDQQDDDTTATFSIRFCNANDLELRTCVRKWMPGSPWWALSRTFTGGVLDEAVSPSTFYSQTEYALPSYGGSVGTDGWTYDGLPEGVESRGPFEQYNDETDFIHPGGDVLDRSLFGVGNIQNTNGCMNSYFLKSSKYVLGHFNSFSITVYGSGGAIDPFSLNIGSPLVVDQFGLPQDTGGSAQDVSLMDGEGGPGGKLPTETTQLDHFENSVNGRNPIYNGVDYASTVYGYTGIFRSYGNSGNSAGGINRVIPFWTGPYFNGKLFSTITSSGRNFVTLKVNGVSSYSEPGCALIQSEYTGSSGANYGARTVMPYIQGKRDGIMQQSNALIFETSGNATAQTATLFIDGDQIFSDPFEGYVELNGAIIDNPYLQYSFEDAGCFIEQFGAVNLNSSLSSAGVETGVASTRSFKSNSDHDFGIVFYDDHGRRSFVNPIGSVNVKGFDSSRGENKGPSRVSINLFGDAPKWASKYQFVYGGNRSMSDFIQYTTNNAYVENTALTESDLDVTNGKIYISLNMLQDSTISYSKEFGARGSDGSLSLYKFSPGDKLRVISYGASDNRQYPANLVYDIVDVVRFDPLEDADSNPLIEDINTPDERPSSRYGEFVVVSNKEVDGFSYTDIITAGGNGSKWNQNVIFEIFTPKKFTSADEKVYQEIGDVYNIVYDSNTGQNKYSTSQVTLYDGDVYMRPVAVNTNLPVDGGFSDLLAVDGNATDGSNTLKSNFTNAFLETTTASDLFPSEIKQYGRFNVASSNARQVRREAGIIYSERSDQESRSLNYSSFNASLYPFKDLEERFGNINFMDELGGNLFVIQQDRCTIVPVSATMLTNAMGDEQLIASNNILGKERVYSTKAGCDNNPESVARIDNIYYFAHKSLGKVFRFIEGQGVEDISDVKMGAHFRSKFKNALALSGLGTKSDVRIVGGYDPVKQEYLITILRPNSLQVASSDDEVIVYGCTDPDSINFNPSATRNNGTCEYDDGVTTTACAEVIVSDVVFDPIEIGQISERNITITNTGDGALIIAQAIVQNDPSGTFSVYPDTYYVEAGETTSLNIRAVGGSPGLYSGQVLLQFINSPASCDNDVTFPVSVNVVDDIVEEIVGLITVRFYLGGTLIDQAFADTANGVWTVTIDQNRVIQAIENSYSGPGSRALLEVEIEFDETLGAEITQTDRLTITGEILNGLDGFEFVSL
jgi:hypothetical protein